MKYLLVLAVVLVARRQSDISPADITGRTDQGLAVRLYGSLFFGAVTKIDPIVAAVEASATPLDVMIDAHQLIALDTTGLDALEQLHKAVQRQGGSLAITGLQPQPLSLLQRTGFIGRLTRWTTAAP